MSLQLLVRPSKAFKAFDCWSKIDIAKILEWVKLILSLFGFLV